MNTCELLELALGVVGFLTILVCGTTMISIAVHYFIERLVERREEKDGS